MKENNCFKCLEKKVSDERCENYQPNLKEHNCIYVKVAETDLKKYNEHKEDYHKHTTLTTMLKNYLNRDTIPTFRRKDNE